MGVEIKETKPMWLKVTKVISLISIILGTILFIFMWANGSFRSFGGTLIIVFLVLPVIVLFSAMWPLGILINFLKKTRRIFIANTIAILGMIVSLIPLIAFIFIVDLSSVSLLPVIIFSIFSVSLLAYFIFLIYIINKKDN